MKKVFLVFGTRPEAIKMYPVFKALNGKKGIQTKVIITSQHQEMLKQVIDIFKIPIAYDLDVMEDKQTLSRITVKVVEGMREIFLEEKPELVLVHGDTTTTFASALSAFYEKIPVGHVEAGLRTYNKYSPFPEEMNRKLADALSDMYFAPTERSKESLLKEGIDETRIYVTGNTVVDALNEILLNDAAHRPLFIEDLQDYIIVTAHRRENWGLPMKNICEAIDYLAKFYKRKIKFVFSVHKNPVVREVVDEILTGNENVKLIEPLDYFEFIHLLNGSKFILTDSGGIQEEAPSLKKPVLLLREVTERPEAVEAGVVKIVGTDKERIIQSVRMLIEDVDEYNNMTTAENPFGDGHAGERIADIVVKFLNSGGRHGIS